MFNAPNTLTIIRIILTFVFVYFISQSGFVSVSWAAVIFILACLTDFWDGYLARKYNLISDFGKLMDPIADKFLVLAAFLAFVRMNIVENWMVLVILGREMVVTSLRILGMTKGVVLAAERAGKHKTVSQMVAIFAILGFVWFKELLTVNGGWTTTIEDIWRGTIVILMLITVALTVMSGVSYCWNNRKLLS